MWKHASQGVLTLAYTSYSLEDVFMTLDKLLCQATVHPRNF